MKQNITTLCYIEKDDCYLMLHRVKKAVDINKDKWIGIGGHLEEENPRRNVWCVRYGKRLVWNCLLTGFVV